MPASAGMTICRLVRVFLTAALAAAEHGWNLASTVPTDIPVGCRLTGVGRRLLGLAVRMATAVMAGRRRTMPVAIHFSPTRMTVPVLFARDAGVRP